MITSTFELWDTESSNVIGEFETQAAAYAAVREAVDLNGADSVDLWALIESQHSTPGEDWQYGVVGHGAGQWLVEQAQRHKPT